LKYSKDGAKGYELIERTLPRIILLDINLPTMNGIQIIEKLRSNKRYNCCKIIVVSANMKKKIIDLGANGYIIKPLVIPKLIKKKKNQSDFQIIS
jgi:DNA-binding response OmpR family regulator